MSNVSKGGGVYLFRILDILLWVMLVRGGGGVPLQNPRYIVMSNVSKGGGGGTDLFRILDIMLWVMLVRGGGEGTSSES